ncbi:MAG: hypothetical protein ACTTJO_00380 [Metamycoplasmataceae bacterium]|uniref:hypothetical protein n=1 Tax=Mycoplasmopsis lipophila TaxID=2117 RepID=UPI0038733909
MNNKDIRDIDTREYYINLFSKYQNFLTTTQQNIFKLYFFENLSYFEISEIVATTRTSVYDSLKKALHNLEKCENKSKTF